MGHGLDVYKDWEAVDRLASCLEEWAKALSSSLPIQAYDEEGVFYELLTDGRSDKPAPRIISVTGPPPGQRPISIHAPLGSVVGKTFAAHARIGPNPNPTSPYCIEVCFDYARIPGMADRPLLPVSTAERCIYVRVDEGLAANKGDVRPFRRALGGLLDPSSLDAPIIDLRPDVPEEDGPKVTWQLGMVERSDIRWNEECPIQDRRAPTPDCPSAAWYC